LADPLELNAGDELKVRQGGSRDTGGTLPPGAAAGEPHPSSRRGIFSRARFSFAERAVIMKKATKNRRRPWRELLSDFAVRRKA
jgi:hypothetical protein